jgi:HK97 gp10 family phage protein
VSGVTITGLRELGANLQALGALVQKEIGREALLQASLLITAAVKDATYTTFNRITGFTQSGFGVRVGKEMKGTVLSAVVVQYPQNITGTDAMARLVQHYHTPRPHHGSVAVETYAYWWRFLEFGTHGRHARRTPKFAREGRIARNRRQASALARYAKSASLGDLAPRPWVGPAFNASAQAAIQKFTSTTREQIEQRVNAMPK